VASLTLFDSTENRRVIASESLRSGEFAAHHAVSRQRTNGPSSFPTGRHSACQSWPRARVSAREATTAHGVWRSDETSRRSAMSSSPGNCTRHRCAVLVGAVGAGKSSVGNALCSPSDSPPFRSRRSASGVTSECACAPSPPPGLGGVAVADASERWWIVDTPGLCDGDDVHRGQEHLLQEIEKCVVDDTKAINPTGGVDVFLLVFNSTGRINSSVLDSIERLKQRFGAARFLERCVAVFTHADVLRRDGCSLRSYLSEAPEDFTSFLKGIGGGDPIFAEVGGGDSYSPRTVPPGATTPEVLTPETVAHFTFKSDVASAMRRVDEVTSTSELRSAGARRDGGLETRVVAEDVAAARAARAPKLGMKAARRKRQEERRKERFERSENEKSAASPGTEGVSRDLSRVASTSTSTSTDWFGEAAEWFRSLIAPKPRTR